MNLGKDMGIQIGNIYIYIYILCVDQKFKMATTAVHTKCINELYPENINLND